MPVFKNYFKNKVDNFIQAVDAATRNEQQKNLTFHDVHLNFVNTVLPQMMFGNQGLDVVVHLLEEHTNSETGYLASLWNSTVDNPELQVSADAINFDFKMLPRTKWMGVITPPKPLNPSEGWHFGFIVHPTQAKFKSGLWLRCYVLEKTINPSSNLVSQVGWGDRINLGVGPTEGIDNMFAFLANIDGHAHETRDSRKTNKSVSSGSSELETIEELYKNGLLSEDDYKKYQR